MHKKLALLTMTAAVAVWAADAWTKAPVDWNDKDLEKVMFDSPWGDRMAVETGQRGNVGNADDTKGAMQGNLTAPIWVAWRTALPIRLAVARQSKQAANEAEQTVTVLSMSGFPAQFRADAADIAKLTADTVIKVKGKPEIHPMQVEVTGGPALAGKGAPGGAPGGGPGGGKGGFKGGAFGNFDVILAFPKNLGLTVDDKEFEFVSKVGKMTIRKKVKLQEMVFNGKLEM
jgi:hypothetical protein